MTAEPRFTHLHVHSEYSLLDGMGQITPLVERAKALGMDALALTDHGVLYGAVEFYLACREAGIKPIIGCEGYLSPGDHKSKTAADRNPSHLVLLAKDLEGYHNLVQLNSKAHLDGYYYKPRFDHDLLAQHSKGLIALSACIGGEVPQLVLQGRMDEARARAGWYKDVFGADYYFELQGHGNLTELDTVNRGLLELAPKLGIPLVGTNDLHFINAEDAEAHDILLCIGTNSTVGEEKRLRMSDNSYYLKSQREMADLFRDYPEAVLNTQRIAEQVNVELEFGGNHLPNFPTPAGMSADDYLAQMCLEGLERRYGERATEAHRNRLQYELEVIVKTQFANYFLVVWDFVRYAQSVNVPYGVRGSAAGSIVLYCLGITQIDPIETRLVFERFLNVERKEMPDIDLDFADDRRQQIIDYVVAKYGRDHVAQIITFGTLGAKAALRDVGRALGMEYGQTDRIAKLVPTALHMTLERALEESAELAEIYRSEASAKKLVDAARQLEGISRHASTHAAGVVISREPLMEIVPLQRPARGDDDAVPTTQYNMEDVARIGLLKMDFLGLTNLTILGRALEMIKETTGQDIDLLELPWDDAKTYAMLAEAQTTAVFQLESSGMRKYIKDLRPNTLGDLAAMVALYRPGPMQHIPTFIKAKHGIEPVQFPHPALAEILSDTYGVIVYQDQVLLILQHFAGYTLGRADIVRKAMGKKKADLLAAEKMNFLKGAEEKGFDRGAADAIFGLIEPFAGYAFNKAHATSYALVSYQTAYLKANYPAQYMAAVLTSFADVPDKLAGMVAECLRLGVVVLPPHINRSKLRFSVETVEMEHRDGTVEQRLGIRFGLAAIKNVGEGAVEGVITARDEGGDFSSLEDFCRRADLHALNKRTMECLIKAGAFDHLGKRGVLAANLDRIMALAQREQKNRDSGQVSMFDLFGAQVQAPMPSLDLVGEDAGRGEKLAWEKELLGVYLSEHPFTAHARRAASDGLLTVADITEESVGQSVAVAAMVAQVRQVTTKTGRAFWVVALEDLTGSIEATVWQEAWERTRTVWVAGNVVLVRGKVQLRNQLLISCDSAERYGDDAAVEPPPFEPENEPGYFDNVLLDMPLAPAGPEPEPERELVSAGVGAGAQASLEDGGAPSPIPMKPGPVFYPSQPAATPPPMRVSAPPGAGGSGRPNGNGGGNGSAKPYGGGNGGNGGGGNGNGGKYANGGGGNGAGRTGGPRPGSREEEPVGPRTVLVSLHESDDAESDEARLNEVLTILRRNQGRDNVLLEIQCRDSVVHLEADDLRTRYSPTMQGELTRLLGEAGVRVLEEAVSEDEDNDL